MKIIAIRKYKYPIDKTKKWEKDKFQPIDDLKLSLKLDDGNIIECATFHMIMEGKDEQHACVSTQAGCKFGCEFCTSGEKGFVRNLSKEEIKEELEILLSKRRIKKFDRILFMGIGEPLDNYEQVIGCIKELIANDDLYNGHRQMALATNVIPSQLIRLAQEKLPLTLWISLHAVVDEKRKRLMPVAAKYSISEVLDAAEEYCKKVEGFVWLNYMLFSGFNDTDEDVKIFAKLMKGKEDIFKLMITEPNNSIDGFKKANYSDLLNFESKLKESGVKNEIIRFVTAGKDVGAGCGEFIFIPKGA